MQNWQRLQNKVKPNLSDFCQAVQTPNLVQQNILQEILSTNQETVFGRKYRFGDIRNYQDFITQVPLNTYETLAPYIQRIQNGESQILTAESTIAFEMTGGSTQGSKLIPYTSSGLTAFRQGIFPWLADLLQHRPRIMTGITYWSISPATRPFTTTPAGIPIGSQSDAAYFGEDIEAWIIDLLAVPPQIAQIADVAQWRYQTVLALLLAEDLSFISVWSPTFLLQLLEEIQQQSTRLIQDVSAVNPVRGKLIADAVDQNYINTHKIWANLDTISCWTNAAAKAFIPQLQALFPHTYIQGKGLLATEGVVTLPLCNYEAPVLAIQSGFYEFLDDENVPHLCEELEKGQIYRVVMTTHSGLYRYELGDRVLVKGWLKQTPLLEFVGRFTLVSDICGEKLTEEFVLEQLGQQRGFTMLAPSLQPKPHYILFLDAAEYDSQASLTLAQRLDRDLTKNPQYAYARKLGQLGELVPYRVQNPMAIYINSALEKKQRLGDIKPPVLSRLTDWQTRFESGC